jgi:hypothetical protein
VFKKNRFERELARYGHMQRSIGHIQTNREYYLPGKKARALERGCIVAKKGAKGPIFEGNMLPQKMYPFLGPVNGAIAWKLWRQKSLFTYSKFHQIINSSPAIMLLAALYFGVIFKGAYLPQNMDPNSNIET